MQLRRLSLAVAATAALSCPLVLAAPDTVELDLVFPRNETYPPVYPFPIVFALRNPAAIWPFDFNLFSTLEWWSDEEDRVVSTRAGFRELGHYPNSRTHDHSPVYPDDLGDPLFLINATFVVDKIINTTATAATLRWQFGLNDNCSVDALPGANVPRPSQLRGHVDFSFASDGALPDFGDAYNVNNSVKSCPIGLGAFDIVGQMNLDGLAGGICPILHGIERQPEPNPCELTINEQLGTRVADAMMASARCDEGAVWPNPTATSCEQFTVSFSPRAIQAGLGWSATLALAIAAFASV